MKRLGGAGREQSCCGHGRFWQWHIGGLGGGFGGGRMGGFGGGHFGGFCGRCMAMGGFNRGFGFNRGMFAGRSVAAVANFPERVFLNPGSAE